MFRGAVSVMLITSTLVPSAAIQRAILAFPCLSGGSLPSISVNS
jgi:hypothetical protein